MITRNDGKRFFTFDCHNHTGEGALIEQFLQNGQREFWIKDLIANMDKFGCDMSVTFPVGNPHSDYYTHNVRVLEDAKAYPDRIVPFIRLNPLYEDTVCDHVDEFFAKGAKGIKLHPQREGFYPADDQVVAYRMYEASEKYEATYLIHSGEVWVNTPALIAEAARNFPKCKFIIGHCGHQEYIREAWNAGRDLDNVFLDITELYPPSLVRVSVNKVGKEKVLWGTDQPYIPLGAEIDKLLYWSGLTDDEIECVFGKNLARILDMPIKTFS